MLCFVALLFQLLVACALSQEAGCAQDNVGEYCDGYAFVQKSFVVDSSQKRTGNRGSSHVHVSTRSYGVGNASCPCVGIAGSLGHVTGTDSSSQFYYPADVGSQCQAWDAGVFPACKEDNESYCSDAWCYVDPCNCNLDVLPKVSTVLTGASFQGRSLYYSYATCGSTDSYTEGSSPTACVNQKTDTNCSAQDACAWTGTTCMGKELASTCSEPPVAPGGGSTGCKCIGINGTTGSVTGTYTVDDKMFGVVYPSTVGSSCSAWDLDVHYDCVFGKDKPSWCSEQWCYVDPCTCGGLNAVPKVSQMLNGATFQNKTLYFSYATCGSQDTYTAGNSPSACVNQMTPADCSAQSECGWTGTACVGRELTSVCSGQNAETVPSNSGAATTDATTVPIKSGAATTMVPIVLMTSLALLLKM